MRTIHKYILRPGKPVIKLPSESNIMSVINQQDNIVVYAEVNSEDTDTSKVEFKVFSTGDDISSLDDDFMFLGTVSLVSGFVFHVYYRFIYN